MIVDDGEICEELGTERQPVFDGDVDAVVPVLENEAGPGDASWSWDTMYIAFPTGGRQNGVRRGEGTVAGGDLRTNTRFRRGSSRGAIRKRSASRRRKTERTAGR